MKRFSILMLSQSLAVITLLVGLVGQPASANNIFYPLQSNFRVPRPSTFAPNRDGGKLIYFGGPVISNVKVYAVYWGAQVDGDVQKTMGGFYKSIVDSTEMDWSAQYNTAGVMSVDGKNTSNQKIGRGTYGGEYLITPIETKTDIDDGDIHKELEAQIEAKVLPAPDENSLYMIYFPPGVTISIAGGSSCSSFCAYHNGYASSRFGSVFYGVIPDFTKGNCSWSCGFANKVDKNTIISSHEFFEAVTDAFPTPGNNPQFPQAWNTSDGQEVGDLCAGTAGDLVTPNKTYRIQGEWDNALGTCVTGPYQGN